MTTSLPTTDTAMTAFLPANQEEPYSFMDESGNILSKTESLETTWFFTGPADIKCANDKACTSDGLFKLSRTNLNETNLFYAPQTATPTTRGRVLIAVARDNRGGNMVKRYCVGTCP